MPNHPAASRRVQCSLCPKTITLNNFSTHLKTKHPAQHGHPPRSRWFKELGETATSSSLPVVPMAATPDPVIPSPSQQTPPLAAAADPERAPGLPPLEVDEIVLAVVESLAEPSGMVPVAHIPALFAWREATAVFLRSVRS